MQDITQRPVVLAFTYLVQVAYVLLGCTFESQCHTLAARPGFYPSLNIMLHVHCATAGTSE